MKASADAAGKLMRENDWTMVLASAEVFVRFGLADTTAQRIDDAVKKVGGRKRALKILMEE